VIKNFWSVSEFPAPRSTSKVARVNATFICYTGTRYLTHFPHQWNRLVTHPACGRDFVKVEF
jgi:hypothetical protein